ncbi:hypothetical protein, partial [Thiolapillus sp.]|uniref:hypothetical protein n=1 Tax=Thiolapillus sp. TaxID=2017437 RepID=UPI003AF8D597
TLIIQSSLTNEAEVWASFPRWMQQQVIKNDIRVFYIDGFMIAREEASNPELQLRMQGNAFQGAFFAGSPLMEITGMDEKKLFTAIENQLQAKAKAWWRTTCASYAGASMKYMKSPAGRSTYMPHAN